MVHSKTIGSKATANAGLEAAISEEEIERTT
jgi:hypothetical protein